MVFLALGAYVLSVRPTRPGNVPFGTYSVGFGLGLTCSNVAFTLLPDGGPLATALFAVASLSLVAASGALPGVGVGFPTRRHAARDAAIALVALALFVAAPLALLGAADADEYAAAQGVTPALRDAFAWFTVAFLVLFAANWWTVARLSLEGRAQEARDQDVRDRALMCAALVLNVAFGGGNSLLSDEAPDIAIGVATIAGTLVLAGLWLTGRPMLVAPCPARVSASAASRLRSRDS